jgi:hypothetical protein
MLLAQAHKYEANPKPKQPGPLTKATQGGYVAAQHSVRAELDSCRCGSAAAAAAVLAVLTTAVLARQLHVGSVRCHCRLLHHSHGHDVQTGMTADALAPLTMKRTLFISSCSQHERQHRQLAHLTGV